MITKYFEELLEQRYKPNPEAEAMWDSRSEQFSHSQQSEKTGFPSKVTDLLARKGYLPDNTVLDIGGGTGRYALHFAKIAKYVTITDLSSGMLEQARMNIEREGLTNVSYQKLNWDEVEITGSKYEKSHDVAFASMCPAVRTKSGILKMIETANKGCVINQFIKTRDTLVEELKSASDMADQYDPHNDRETLQATFNILWELGYNVQLAYHTCSRKNKYTVQEAIDRYGGRFASKKFSVEGKEMCFNKIIEFLSCGGKIEVESDTILATIFWDV